MLRLTHIGCRLEKRSVVRCLRLVEPDVGSLGWQIHLLQNLVSQVLPVKDWSVQSRAENAGEIQPD